MTMDELAAEVHRKNCIEGTHDDACTAISDMRESLAAAKKFAEQYEGFIASEECKLDEARKHAATLCLCEYNHRCIWCVVEESRDKSATLQEIIKDTTNQVAYWMNQYETMHEQASDLARNLRAARMERAEANRAENERLTAARREWQRRAQQAEQDRNREHDAASASAVNEDVMRQARDAAYAEILRLRETIAKVDRLCSRYERNRDPLLSVSEVRRALAEPERCGFMGTAAEHRAMGCCDV